MLTHVRGQRCLQLILSQVLTLIGERHVGDRLVTGQLILHGADASLHHSGVGDQCRLNLNRGEAVTRNVDHVVNAAEDVHVTLFVFLRAVASEEPATLAVVTPVGIQEALRVLPHGTSHGRANLVDHDEALLAGFDRVAVFIHHTGGHAGNSTGSATGQGGAVRGTLRVGALGCERGVVRARGAHGRTGLGLPPGVDERRGAAAHVLTQPAPRLRVDGFAHRTEQTHGREVVLAGLRAVGERTHEGANQGRRGVVVGHAVTFNDLKVAAVVRGVRGTLVNHLGDAVNQRTVNFVGVRGHPCEVGGAPVNGGFYLLGVVDGGELVGAQHAVLVHVVGQQIVEQRVSVRGLHQVAGHRVHQALGLTGRAGGVNNEQRIFCVVQFVGVGVRLVVDQVVVPDVAALSPRHSGVRYRVGGAGAVHHDDVLDVVLTGACFVGVDLHGNDLAAAVLAVGGDEYLRAGVFHTELQRLGGETTEHEGVNRTNTRAGEGEDDGFGDDGQVDDHAVTLAHAQGQQAVGGLRDAALQLGVGDGFAVAGLTLEVEGDLVAAARLHVAVHAVVGDVQLTALEPLNFGDRELFDAVLIEAEGLRLLEAVRSVPGLSPGEALRLLLPERDACLVRFERGVRGGVQRVGERVGGGQSHYSPIGCWH